MMIDNSQLLKVDVTRDVDMAIVKVEGELDMATAPQLEAPLSYLTTSQLVLDLRQVGFIDSSGLHSLLDARAKFDGARRVRLVVRNPSPVLRLLEMTGLSDQFVIDRVHSD